LFSEKGTGTGALKTPRHEDRTQNRLGEKPTIGMLEGLLDEGADAGAGTG